MRIVINSKTKEEELKEDDVLFTEEERLNNRRLDASLSRMDFFLSLDEMGLYDQVWALKDDEQIPKRIRIMLETASTFNRLNEDLIQMAHSLEFSDEELDILFGLQSNVEDDQVEEM